MTIEEFLYRAYVGGQLKILQKVYNELQVADCMVFFYDKDPTVNDVEVYVNSLPVVTTRYDLKALYSMSRVRYDCDIVSYTRERWLLRVVSWCRKAKCLDGLLVKMLG